MGTVDLQGCHDQHISPAGPAGPGITTQFVSMFPSQRLHSGEQNRPCQPHPGTTGTTGAKLQLCRGTYRGEHYREQDEGGGETSPPAFLCCPQAVWREETQEECSLLQHQ